MLFVEPGAKILFPVSSQLFDNTNPSGKLEPGLRAQLKGGLPSGIYKFNFPGFPETHAGTSSGLEAETGFDACGEHPFATRRKSTRMTSIEALLDFMLLIKYIFI